MVETPGDLDLAEKPLCAHCRGHIGSQDLQSDDTIVSQIVSPEDNSHAASTELLLDAIAIGNGGAESRGEIRHDALLYRPTSGSSNGHARPVLEDEDDDTNSRRDARGAGGRGPNNVSHVTVP